MQRTHHHRTLELLCSATQGLDQALAAVRRD
jgi:hypothetical protein